jgi:hypothetical protein
MVAFNGRLLVVASSPVSEGLHCITEYRKFTVAEKVETTKRLPTK